MLVLSIYFLRLIMITNLIFYIKKTATTIFSLNKVVTSNIAKSYNIC